MDSWDELMQFIRERAEERISNQAKAYKLMLAAEELLSNVIRASASASQSVDSDGSPVMADSPQAIIRLIWTDSQPEEDLAAEVILDMYDTCPRFDPQFELIGTHMEDIPVEQRAIGGLGLFLVKSSVDEIQYDYVDGMNHYRLGVHATA